MGEVANRSVGAEVAVQPLEHRLVAGERRALQVFVALAFGDPALRRLEKRPELALLVARLGLALQLAQDGVETLLGVPGGEMLGRRAGAVACSPDDRAAWAAAAGVAHVSGTESAASSYAMLVSPERPIRPGGSFAIGLDLEMPRRARCAAHDAYDLLELEPANELGRRIELISPGFP